MSIISSLFGGGKRPGNELSRDELARYSRHIQLPEVGLEGQAKLRSGSVLVVGAGGLGSPALLYLAAAGVGRIGIVDYDAVDMTNLQRQIVHGTKDVGTPKTASASTRIHDVNPHVNVETHKDRLTSENALEMFRPYDVIIDGSDNFPTRYLVNDACVLLGKPYVYGSIFRFEGQASVFMRGRGACYRCLYPEPPPPGAVPSCAEGGVLGVLPGTIGCIQATEAIKLLLGIGEPLINRLLLFDALAMSFRELKLNRDPSCPVCGDHPTVTALIDYEQYCGLSPTPSSSSAPSEIEPLQLKQMIDSGRHITVLDVREPYEVKIASLPFGRHIPMNDIPGRMSELDPTHDTVVFCRGGGRSARVIEFLKEQGFTGRLFNLKGGILAWSDQVDPSVKKY